MIFEFPLQWPEGWPRTDSAARRWSGVFKVTHEQTRRHLMDELRRLGATDAIVSSNVRVRARDAMPYSDEFTRRIADPGVSLFFKLRGRGMMMARDAYDSPWGNLHSLKLAIEHLRGLERHGGNTMTEKAFTGFAALPPPKHWSTILGVAPTASLDEIGEAYRARAREIGNTDSVEMRDLNLARDAARKERG